MSVQVEIPQKLYFKIGEVARLCGLEPYVLRYWETEFKEIVPVKSRTNQRLYRRKDIETVLEIKNLLHKDGFTIEGARRKIREMSRQEKESEDLSSQIALALEESVSSKFLEEIKSRLERILRLVEK